MKQSGVRNKAQLDGNDRDNNDMRTLVVIGVHREELAFGDQVALGLDGQMIDVLRIPRGLSARRPRADQLATYRARHARLYEQICDHLQPIHGIVIDLHCSIGADPVMDIICANAGYLATLQECCKHAEGLQDAIVRTIQMVSDDDIHEHEDVESGSQLFMKPDLPSSIWKARRPLYIGLEIYLQEEGAGICQDWQRSQSLIQIISQSGLPM